MHIIAFVNNRSGFFTCLLFGELNNIKEILGNTMENVFLACYKFINILGEFVN